MPPQQVKRPYWRISSFGVRFNVPQFPKFPAKIYNSKTTGGTKKFNKGVTLSSFTRTIAQQMPKFRRRVGRQEDFSNIADQMYSRQLDHHHIWHADVLGRRSRLRYGKQKNAFIEYGQPNLIGGRLRFLWTDLYMAHFEMTQKKSKTLGFDRHIPLLESSLTNQNRNLELEGLKVLRQRKAAVQLRLSRSNPFV